MPLKLKKYKAYAIKTIKISQESSENIKNDRKNEILFTVQPSNITELQVRAVFARVTKALFHPLIQH